MDYDFLGLEGRSRSKSVGEQQWTNLRAVMAWYSRLRRIKRSKSNQRWMKLRTTVQLSGAISSTIQKKAPLKREDSFLKRFSTRQIPEAQASQHFSPFFSLITHNRVGPLYNGPSPHPPQRAF
ncbi:unnamed protein product [Allacma fusca]|uniref:Uncharacterized protein n=1 Tax=Allacma fusca TaxID=39272 RepID=A0A8J2LE50_9HEXA|nr:unnamed protein product [Allacma fusca]